MCDHASDATTSGGNDGSSGYNTRSEDFVTRPNELGLDSNECHNGISSIPSAFSQSTPYQIYAVDPIAEVNVNADLEASINRLLNDHQFNHTDQRFFAKLPLFRTHSPVIDDVSEVPSFRPHSPGAESLLANASEGERSMISSVTSSQFGKRSVSPEYFTIGVGGCFERIPDYFLRRPLELTETLQHKHHCRQCVVCGGSPLAREIIIDEDPSSARDDGWDEGK